MPFFDHLAGPERFSVVVVSRRQRRRLGGERVTGNPSSCRCRRAGNRRGARTPIKIERLNTFCSRSASVLAPSYDSSVCLVVGQRRGGFECSTHCRSGWELAPRKAATTYRPRPHWLAFSTQDVGVCFVYLVVPEWPAIGSETLENLGQSGAERSQHPEFHRKDHQHSDGSSELF